LCSEWVRRISHAGRGGTGRGGRAPPVRPSLRPGHSIHFRGRGGRLGQWALASSLGYFRRSRGPNAAWPGVFPPPRHPRRISGYMRSLWRGGTGSSTPWRGCSSAQSFFPVAHAPLSRAPQRPCGPVCASSASSPHFETCTIPMEGMDGVYHGMARLQLCTKCSIRTCPKVEWHPGVARSFSTSSPHFETCKIPMEGMDGVYHAMASLHLCTKCSIRTCPEV
jgi:hypothetical protein